MSATINFIGSRDNPDYVYYNALIINNTVQTSQTTPDPAVIFQDTRDVPILKDSSNYVLSVEKFTLDGALKNLPIFIPQIQTPIADVNLTVYTITFTWSNGTNLYQDTQPLIWTPEDKSPFAPVPVVDTPIQSETPYYYMYTFQHWVDIINTALTKAYNNVKTVAGVGFGGTVCPFFSYDAINGLFSVSQDVNTSVVPYGQSLPQPFGIPSSIGASPVGSYLANEFSSVAYNTNFEALINNLPTNYYADTIVQGQGYEVTVFVAPQFKTSLSGITYSGTIPIGAVSFSLTQSTNLVSGVTYTIPSGVSGKFYNASGTSVGTISASDTLTYTASLVPITYAENVVVPTINAGMPIIQSYTSTNKNVSALSINTGSIINPFTCVVEKSSTTPVYVITTEEMSSTDSLWSPVQSFVIITSQLPIINELSANPVTLGNTNLGYAQQSGNAFNRIVLEVPVDTRYTDYFSYEPKVATYTSFSPSHDALRTIDFQIKWRNRLTNTLTPVQLYNLGTASVRLLFKKKGAE